MAEIIAKFNTKTKYFEVTKDGQKMDNVSRCAFGMNYEGEYMCNIDMMKKDKEEGTHEMSALYADKDKYQKVIDEAKNYLKDKFQV